jgi:hypothetical protein
MDLGFKNIVNENKSDNYRIGALFTSRGQQQLNVSGSINKLSFISNLIFNTYAQELSNTSLFQYKINDKTSASAVVNVSQGELEVGTSVTHRMYDNLTVEACLSWLYNQSGSIHFYFSPSKSLDVELEYESHFDTNKMPYGSLTSKWNLKATDFTNLIGDYTYDLNENSSDMTFGLQTTAFENSVLKSVVNSEGDLKSEVKYTWSENLKFIVSSKFSLEELGLPSESEFGMGCEYS